MHVHVHPHVNAHAYGMCTQVRLYAEKHLVASLRINEPVTACRFGCYGREEGCLAVVGASGSLTIKMLQRTTKFEPTSGSAGPPPEQDVPLSIPKKTKLYVEQTQREREQATEMHRIFQRDLCKLRLSTARAYVHRRATPRDAHIPVHSVHSAPPTPLHCGWHRSR